MPKARTSSTFSTSPINIEHLFSMVFQYFSHAGWSKVSYNSNGKNLTGRTRKTLIKDMAHLIRTHHLTIHAEQQFRNYNKIFIIEMIEPFYTMSNKFRPQKQKIREIS